MSAALDPLHVSAESVARARDFRARVEGEDAAWLAAIRTALRPVTERRERHPDRPLRYENLAALSHESKLRAPQRFRISFTAHVQRTHGAITERRLGIGRLDTELAEPGVHRSAAILTVFSLRAIVTRFARGTGIKDAAVISDMAEAAAVDLDKLGPAGGGVRVSNWRGRSATVKDSDGSRRRIVCVNTC
jgi:hypothetical protein